MSLSTQNIWENYNYNWLCSGVLFQFNWLKLRNHMNLLIIGTTFGHHTVPSSLTAAETMAPLFGRISQMQIEGLQLLPFQGVDTRRWQLQRTNLNQLVFQSSRRVSDMNDLAIWNIIKVIWQQTSLHWCVRISRILIILDIGAQYI